MRPGLLGCQPLGFFQATRRLDGLPGISQFHRDPDGVKGHVRGAEFGVVIVAVFAEALCYLGSLVEMGVCVLPVVVTRGWMA